LSPEIGHAEAMPGGQSSAKPPGNATMTPTATVQTGLRTLYNLGGDWFWFFIALGAGLLLAAWTGGIAFEALVPPHGARG